MPLPPYTQLYLADISHTMWAVGILLVVVSAALAVGFRMFGPEGQPPAVMQAGSGGRKRKRRSSGGESRTRKARRSSSRRRGDHGDGVGNGNGAREAYRRRQRESKQDFFKLDMSRYKDTPLVDTPPASEELHLAYWLKGAPEEVPPVGMTAPKKADFPLPVSTPAPVSNGDGPHHDHSPGTNGSAGAGAQLTTTRQFSRGAASQRSVTIPSGVTKIMDMLKSNRRYEFGEVANRHERLGAATSGGLFAEVQFGRSEDDSVLQGGLNPD